MIKKVFWGLLVLNMAFAVYDRSQQPPVATLSPELRPVQMKLLSEQALTTYPRRAMTASETPALASPLPPVAAVDPVATAGAQAAGCYEWGSFNQSKANKAIALTRQLGINAIINKQTAANENTRYWIYQPPLPSQEAAQNKAEELRQLGVQEVFVVQEAKWRNAISFGVFRDEKLADKLMDELRARGVGSAIKSTRYGGQGQAILHLQAISDAQANALKAAQPQFPDTVLKPIACVS